MRRARGDARGKTPQKSRQVMSTKKTVKTKAQGASAGKAQKQETSAETKAQPKKLSALDAAAKVLGETGEPMNCKELIDAMAAKGYWKSPGGQTPWATLYAAMLREIKTKGADARFRKNESGKFVLVNGK